MWVGREADRQPYSGTRIDPYEGRTSGKRAAAKRSASSSFQRWLALASKKPRLSRVSGDGRRMAAAAAVLDTGHPASDGTAGTPPPDAGGAVLRPDFSRRAARGGAR